MNITGSFKRIGRGYLATIGLDTIQYAVMLLIVLSSTIVVYRLYIPLINVQQTANEVNQKIAENNELPQISKDLGDKMEQAIQTVKGFIARLITLAAITYALLLFCSGIGRSIVYSRLTKTRLTKRFIARFVKYNTLWVLFWTAIFVLDLLMFKTAVSVSVLLALIMLYLHFSAIFRYSFDTRHGFKRIMHRVFYLGIKKGHRFIMPFILLMLVFVIINLIPFLITFIQFNVVLFLVLAAFLSFMSWARLYYITVIDNIR